MAQGIENLVVDSASSQVDRRARRAKTDSQDADKLVRMLIRFHNGEKKVWSVVRVPSVEAEDQRHLHRQLMSFKRDRTRQINRIKGLLIAQGIRLETLPRDFSRGFDQARPWDGSPLPPGLRARIEQEHRPWQVADEQVEALHGDQRRAIREEDSPQLDQVHQLMERAWRWLRMQPRSALTRWYHRRFAKGGHASGRSASWPWHRSP